MAGNNAETPSTNNWVHDRRIQPANAFTMVSFSDSDDLVLVDLTAEGADHRLNVAYCRGFHVNADGWLSLVPAGQVDDRSIIRLRVNEGAYYPYQIKRFRLTGTTIGNGTDQVVAWR